jgi:ketol-acid reductoisomerase
MPTVYRETDVAPLLQKAVAVLGYGSQGRAQALNLRDSGVELRVGVRPGASAERARTDGFEPVSVRSAAEGADVLALCLPDVEMGRMFEEEIRPVLREGAALVFAHGFAVHYGLVQAPQQADVVLVAPMGAGPVVRQRFEEGSGVPGLVAVGQDATGTALEVALGYGSAIGLGRVAMLETTFREETESDLFGEQAVLCGGLPELMRASFRTLAEGGVQPEIAYIAAVHEVKLIVDLIYERGLDGMVQSISGTAEWGAYEAGPKVIGEESRNGLRELWERVRSGAFARDWIEEAASGGNELARRRKVFLDDPLHEVGTSVRGWTDLSATTRG